MYCKRLKRGDDLLLEIQKIADKYNIQCGVVLSSVGCVTTATVRDASGVNFQTVNEDMEIISVNGTVSKQRTHLHVAFSKEDLSVIGGHLVEGCLINTTCELVIADVPNTTIEVEMDEQTGYDELKFIEV